MEIRTKEQTDYILVSNELIAKFLGYEKVRVGYWGDDDPEDGESEWQRNNRVWMEEINIDSVGNYWVNIKENKCIEPDVLNYHQYWGELMEAWEYARKKVWDMGIGYPKEYFYMQEKYANRCIYPNIEQAYEVLLEVINWYNSTKQ